MNKIKLDTVKQVIDWLVCEIRNNFMKNEDNKYIIELDCRAGDVLVRTFIESNKRFANIKYEDYIEIKKHFDNIKFKYYSEMYKSYIKYAQPKYYIKSGFKNGTINIIDIRSIESIKKELNELLRLDRYVVVHAEISDSMGNLYFPTSSDEALKILIIDKNRIDDNEFSNTLLEINKFAECNYSYLSHFKGRYNKNN